MNKPGSLIRPEGPPPLDSPAAREAARSGFSLIEVLFAAGLVSFLLAGTAELLLTSIQIDRVSERTVRLAGVLSSEIDSFKSRPFAAPELDPGTGELVLHPDPDGPAVIVAWSITAVSQDLKRVHLALSREGAGERPLEAVLLITRELAGK